MSLLSEIFNVDADDAAEDEMGACGDYETPKRPFSLWDISLSQVILAVMLAGIVWVLAWVILPFGDYIGGRP